MRTELFSKGTGGPLILWGTDLRGEKETEELAAKLDTMIPEQPYTLAAFAVEDWNDGFSPWKAETEGQIFGGKGSETLDLLKTEVLPYLEKNIPDVSGRYIAGYSLAGLFALWSVYETELFSGGISCSGSLWFPGWTVYAQNHKIPEKSRIYLSLGGKEKNSRSPVLSKIEENTRLQLELLKGKTADVAMEMNPGGHFADPVNRLAKGIAWMIGTDRAGSGFPV